MNSDTDTSETKVVIKQNIMSHWDRLFYRQYQIWRFYHFEDFKILQKMLKEWFDTSSYKVEGLPY